MPKSCVYISMKTIAADRRDFFYFGLSSELTVAHV